MIAVIIDSAVGSLDRYVGANGHVKHTPGARDPDTLFVLGDTVLNFMEARRTSLRQPEDATASVRWLCSLTTTARPAYFLRVKRSRANIQSLMQDYGFVLSVTASTSSLAVLVTHEPYAAVTFLEHATPQARDSLLPGIVEG